MARPETVDILHRSPLMADVAADVTRELARELSEVELKAGETLFRQGDAADALYLVVSGELEASATLESGRRVHLGRLKPGDPVGELAVLLGGQRGASVEAVSPTVLARLPVDTVSPLVFRSAAFQKALETEAGNRLRRNKLTEIIQTYFDLTDREGIERLRDSFEWVDLEPGDILFRKGDPADSLYLVVSGEIWVVGRNEEGDEVPIATLGGHEVVGEMGPLTDEPRMAAAVASRPCTLVRLTRKRFESLSTEFPQLMLTITRQLVDRLRKSQRQRSAARGGCRRIAVLAADPRRVDTRGLVADLVQRLGPEAQLLGRNEVSRHLGRESLADVGRGDPAHTGLGLWLDEQEATHDFVFYELDPLGNDQASGWTRRCLERVDEILVIADARGDVAPQGLERMIYEERRTNGFLRTAPRTRLVLVHPPQATMTTRTDRWLNARAPDGHYHVRQGDADDMGRLARLLSHRGIGLALGGGGARSLAQVGVVRALDEAGIPVDMISATGMGGIIGAMYSAGMSPARILAETDWRLLRRLGAGMNGTMPDTDLERNRLDNDSRKLFGSTRIEDLWRPLVCASTNLTRQSLSVHRSGPLWKAMRATTAVPGLLPPIYYGEEVHVHGGVVNSLPADLLGDDASHVITVDSRSRSGPTIIANGRNGAEHGWLQRLGIGGWADRRSEHHGAGRINPELLISVVTAASRDTANRARASAELNFLPPLDGVGMIDFEDPVAIEKRGYDYARSLIESLGVDEVRARFAIN